MRHVILSHIYYEQRRPSGYDRSCSGEWCIVTMSSGLAQWVGNEALCSGLRGHSSPCLGRHYQNMLRFGLLWVLEQRMTRICRCVWVCLCVCMFTRFSIFASQPVCLLAECAPMCAVYLRQYCVCLCTDVNTCLCVHMFLSYWCWLVCQRSESGCSFNKGFR